MKIENTKQNGQKLDIVFQDSQLQTVKSAENKQKNIKRGYKDLVLDIFSKSPEVGRLLVRLHDRNKLYHMAQSPDETSRAELTQTIVDLLSFGLEPAEAELISDVLMGLIKQAERDLRRSLSERLAVMEGVPLRIVLKMASDEIFVADPVLRKSRDLKDFDLIYILKSKREEHWRSIAMRPQIASKVVDMLADTGDVDTACILAENKTISISDYALEKFLDMAKQSDKLAKPLLLRDELNSSLVEELYKHVGGVLKAYINENFDINGTLDNTIDQVVSEFITAEDINAVKKESLDSFECMMERGLLAPSVMLDHLRLGKVSNFVMQFSVYCGIPIDVVQEMVFQESGQGMAIACKATHISKADFTNIYLLTSRARGSRLVDESNLSRALRYYDKVTEDMARDLLKKHRH